MGDFAEFAEVRLWGNLIGVVAWDADRGIGNFEYTAEFQTSGIQVAPLTMPLGPRIYSFPELRRESYRGLPGMLADSLPDNFGNLLIDQWLAHNGRDAASFSPIERLCYVGERGMGGLEFQPAIRADRDHSGHIEIERLVELANAALRQKTLLRTHLGTTDKQALEAMQEILRVGTSAGGARAKAVVAWNRETDEIRSGQVSAEAGFEYWLIKFDGVDGNRDKELNDPQGYGRLEYAYYLMATAAGIEMMPSKLRHENGRSHFMTQRFDRTADGGKVMMQSLCALAHFDFHQAGAFSYEQALQVAQRLQLSSSDLVELFRRMVFNVLARNQDDHTKNIAFLMDRLGQWRLAPAFDVTYSYNPQGDWTSRHQMTVNGRRDAFDAEDLLSVAKSFRPIGVKRGKDVISQVRRVLSKWMDFAKEAGVSDSWSKKVAAEHRQL